MAIDRRALVAGHRITLTRPDAMSPLSVGNGEFAFSADITGLQTFPEFHSQGLAHLPDLLRGKPVDPATFSMPNLATHGLHIPAVTLTDSHRLFQGCISKLRLSGLWLF